MILNKYMYYYSATAYNETIEKAQFLCKLIDKIIPLDKIIAQI